MHRILLVFVLLAAAGFAADDFAETKKKAEAGDTVAQRTLGSRYYKGTGVPKDIAEAVKWFCKAAEQGDAAAQNSLGLMYRNGDGVPKDIAEAVKWFRKAAEQGNAMAQHNLGFIYLQGTSVPKDSAEAEKWIRKAADQGNAAAQFNLGAMYGKGDSVPKNNAEAMKWWRKAADQGNAAAQSNLGLRQAASEQAAIEQAAASKQAAKDRYAKSTDRAAKLVIKGLAIGMSIDAALEVVNERLRGVFNHKYEIERNGRSGAYLKPVFDSSPAKFALFMEFYDPKFHIYNGFNFNFEVECKVNNDVVTRIFLPTELTNALFNTADMQASDFLLQIRQNYGVGVKAGDWTVFQFYKAETNWTGWEYSSPEGYRIRVFDDKAIEMKKIPKSNERSFN